MWTYTLIRLRLLCCGKYRTLLSTGRESMAFLCERCINFIIFFNTFMIYQMLFCWRLKFFRVPSFLQSHNFYPLGSARFNRLQYKFKRKKLSQHMWHEKLNIHTFWCVWLRAEINKAQQHLDEWRLTKAMHQAGTQNVQAPRFFPLHVLFVCDFVTIIISIVHSYTSIYPRCSFM